MEEQPGNVDCWLLLFTSTIGSEVKTVGRPQNGQLGIGKAFGDELKIPNSRQLWVELAVINQRGLGLL